MLIRPQGGHIVRLEFKRRLEKDADARGARPVPETNGGLEYFLDIEARKLEFKNPDREVGLEVPVRKYTQRFVKGCQKRREMEDRLIELEVIQKVLLRGYRIARYVDQLRCWVAHSYVVWLILQKEAAAFMENVRSTVLKYITI
uniref:Uncharacterized protein LOC105054272 n=1 Tax=Elaeis guineensis var. tenera TaxID=51953 RepID=A0A8N4F2A1_ELAGV|nr:uncharacterized protein LOC105054272 [Elaeis guineensis]